MSFREELELELKELEKTRIIIRTNEIFIPEEIKEIDQEIKRLKMILTVLK